MDTPAPINVIFDGPPGPEGGRFIEVETDDGRSICAGMWSERQDGRWSLRIDALPTAANPWPPVTLESLAEEVETLKARYRKNINIAAVESLVIWLIILYLFLMP